MEELIKDLKWSRPDLLRIMGCQQEYNLADCNIYESNQYFWLLNDDETQIRCESAHIHELKRTCHINFFLSWKLEVNENAQ